MTKPKTENDDATLEEVITHVQIQMIEHDFNTPEFDTAVKHLERLHKLKPDTRHKQVSADAMLAVVANLVGIGLILRQEQFNVITSKALSFVWKSKV